VQHWHTLTQEHGIENVALIADASNQEIGHLDPQQNQATITLDGSDRQITLQGGR
jgi:hypothetical protein